MRNYFSKKIFLVRKVINISFSQVDKKFKTFLKSLKRNLINLVKNFSLLYNRKVKKKKEGNFTRKTSIRNARPS